MLGKQAGLSSAAISALSRWRWRLSSAPRAADGQADAVHRQRIALAHRLKERMGRTARAHVVFGVHLEPADVRQGLQNIVPVLRFQSGPGLRRNRDTLVSRMHAKHHGNSLDQPLMGESEPARCEPSFSVTFVEAQVPLGTSFQAPLS